MADDDHVTLQSQDGQDYKVEVRVAKTSDTIKNLIEDAGIDAPIPLPNVTGKVLAKVIEYAKYHVEHPDPIVAAAGAEPGDASKPAAATEKRTDDICGWDMDFAKVDQAFLFELILAANYLDMKGLLDLTCKTVANLIKGKTPEEIRKTFNIKNDFTPEEEEQVRKENEVRVVGAFFSR